MPEIPSSEPPPKPASDLVDRVEKYRTLIEKVVTEIGEHPDYEMKRSCSLKNLPERIEFVKDIQSIATSPIKLEKYLVIGADERSRSFCTVDNQAEFEEANVRQILEKYISPVPTFEIFRLMSSNRCSFVLFVIPRQRRRNIIAKATVHAEDSQDGKGKLLLREGDLWTKGSSTGKRLAKFEDWNEIVDEIIEVEAEQRAKIRTAHAIDLAVARERVRSSEKPLIPTGFTDQEFGALMEDICSRRDEARLRVLLERLRDDAVEGWNSLGGYDRFVPTASSSLADMRQALQSHIKNVLRPSINLITLVAVYTVKYGGPTSFIDSVVDLLREVFETSSRLLMPRSVFSSAGQVSHSVEEHVSHTVPALESLISIHLIGAYIAKRGRFEYFKSLFRAIVNSPFNNGVRQFQAPMVFWPLESGSGEPQQLTKHGGRIRLCAERAAGDEGLRRLFGTETGAIAALMQHEFILELDSFIAFPELSPETGKMIKKSYADTLFNFRPDFMAFPLEPIHRLAVDLFHEISRKTPAILQHVVFEPSLLPQLVGAPGLMVFVDFCDAVMRDHQNIYFSRPQLPPTSSQWPHELAQQLHSVREAKKQAGVSKR